MPPSASSLALARALRLLLPAVLLAALILTVPPRLGGGPQLRLSLRQLVGEQRLDRVDDHSADVDFPFNAVLGSTAGYERFGRSMALVGARDAKNMSLVVGAENAYEVVEVDRQLNGRFLYNQTSFPYRTSNLGVTVAPLRMENESLSFLVGDDYRALIFLAVRGQEVDVPTHEPLFNGSQPPVLVDKDYQVARDSKLGAAMDSVWHPGLNKTVVCIGAPDHNQTVVLAVATNTSSSLIQRLSWDKLPEFENRTLEQGPLGFGKHCTVTPNYLLVSMADDVYLYTYDPERREYRSHISLRSKIDENVANITTFEGGPTAVDQNHVLALSPSGTFAFEFRETLEGPRWKFLKLLGQPVRPAAATVQGSTAVIAGEHRTVVLRWRDAEDSWVPQYRLVHRNRTTGFVYARSVVLEGNTVFAGEETFGRVYMWDLEKAPPPTPPPTSPPTPAGLPLPVEFLEFRVCFDAASVVRVREGRHGAVREARIDEVAPGDWVESWGRRGERVWSQVFLTQHSGGGGRVETRGEIYRLEWRSPAESGTIRVTPGHYLRGKRGFVVPEEMRVGDEILVRDGIAARVVNIHKDGGSRVVNVHTMNDGIVVDGVFASCFPKVMVGGMVDYRIWLWWTMWIMKALYLVAGPAPVAVIDKCIHRLAPILTSPLLGAAVLLFILTRGSARRAKRKGLKTV